MWYDDSVKRNTERAMKVALFYCLNCQLLTILLTSTK
nr:MAG TPA: hypothetical protein [Caudoviricetes sp.]